MMRILFSDISKYRSYLMGVATICIIICHLPQNNVLLPSYLKYIMLQGQFGNALFLLLSGLGLYYSLTKHYSKDTSIWNWYKKRYVRILVPYLILKICPSLIIALLNTNTDWCYYTANFCLLTYWKYHDCAWFLSLLVPLYALTPILYTCLFRNNKVLINTLYFVVPLTVIPFIKTDNVILGTIIQHIPDVMAFIIGLSLGYYSQKEKSVNVLWFFAMGVMCLALFFVQHRNFASWYMGICFIVLPIILISLKHCKISFSWLTLLGAISLESYLTNTTLPRYVKMINWSVFSFDVNYGNYLGYFIVIVGGLLWAYLIHKLSAVVIKRL